MEFRELECFVVLSEELHFARTADRLYLSPGRVSQLIGALETRIGGRLFDRTSRRVRLTPLGERFLADLRPAYEALGGAVARATAAARAVEGLLRVGFLATPTELVTGTVAAFERRYPGCMVELVEVPLSDPFSRLRAGGVDVVFTLLPLDEPDLESGAELNHTPVELGLSVRHPLAARASLDAEDLASVALIGLDDPAPRRWREHVAPSCTPSGRPIPLAGTVATSHEGMTQVALNRGAMLFCKPSAVHFTNPAVVFVPVNGLPPSTFGLAWTRSGATAAIRAFNDLAMSVARGHESVAA
ncbi:MAG: LysR family transcriptional regulator [Nonomuraea sp.]|nr:LysR family transcriptional regulator [Nonomuraea sp.]